MFTSLSQFYNSKEWREFRAGLIHARVNPADGILYDEYNGQPLINSYDIVAHHKTPLTMQNVNDFGISLNPENIMLVSQRSHNEIHKRFGYSAQRKAYVVHGAPCSGKTTFVNNLKGNSDLIIDVDNIWQCITGGERYFKPNALKQDMFAVRDCLLDCVKRRVGNWERAWILSAEPFRTPREELAKSCGGELIHIDTDRVTCLERLYRDESRRDVQEQWQKYIEDYFNRYQE